MLVAQPSFTRIGSSSRLLRGRNSGQPVSSRASIAPSAFSARQEHQRHPYHERVLRYPDGVERRIIYPISDIAGPSVEDTAAEDVVVNGNPYRSFSEEAQPDRWGPDDWDVSDLWGGFYDNTAGSSAADLALTGGPSSLDRDWQGAAQSPDFLEQLFSTDFKEARQRHWESIGNSYRVLDGCPWVVPKPLYVLAVPQLTAPQAAMFTLQTRVSHQQLQGELSKVLGRQQPDGSDIISVDCLVEGIVAFEDEAAAEQFGLALESEGHQDVSLAVCDSHELFRLSSSSATVVVLLNWGAELPTPGELESSLRRRPRLE